MEHAQKLEAEELSFAFDEEKILNNVNFTVAEGEFVSILGPSGCGKSTILKLLAGVLPMQTGRILVEGTPIGSKSGHFAYMPQNDLLFSWKTILDNVCLYGQIHGKGKEAREEARRHFAEFGLAGYEDAYPSELSGGMRQRAAFLRTSLCAADILLLDEPFGALDVIFRGNMQDWLLSMRQKLGRTMLLVTHDMDEAIYLSDRILVLSGRPAAVKHVFHIKETNRSREWLYSQGALRKEIFHQISVQE